MAIRIRVSSIARNCYRRTPHIFSPNSQNFFSHQHSNASSTSNSNPLLLKLLHLPNSRIKTTLDHEFPSLPTSLLSLDSLITSLSPSSQKPILVITNHLFLFQFLLLNLWLYQFLNLLFVFHFSGFGMDFGEIAKRKS